MDSAELLSRFPRLFSKDSEIRCPAGWLTEVLLTTEKIDTVVTARPGLRVEVEQIKSKFGNLRYYVKFTTVGRRGAFTKAFEDIDRAIRDLEHKCSSMCEVCGQPSSLGLSSSNHLQNTCEKHRT